MPTPSKRSSTIIKAAVIAAAFLGFSYPLGAFAPLRDSVAVVICPLEPARVRVDTVSVVFFGDMMMHTRQLSYDSRGFVEELEDLIGSADLAVAGAEFTLAGKPYTGYPRFSAPDSYPRNLRDAGVDVLLLANNHILDYGSRGLSRTLEQIGEPYCGAGADPESYAAHNPLIVNVKGVRLALVNFTYGTNAGATSLWPKVSRQSRSEVSAQMASARSRADFVIALPHWGNEYGLIHDKTQEQWAGMLIDEGADAVIGAHPHVVQDTAQVQGVPVVYSMGNAVSNMSAPNTRLELAVVLRLVRTSPSGQTSLLGPELHFLWCTLPGKLKDNYCTIEVEKYLGKRHLWKDPSDYDNMVATYRRVKSTTGIK